VVGALRVTFEKFPAVENFEIYSKKIWKIFRLLNFLIFFPVYSKNPA
jgi:hypothetical protein